MSRREELERTRERLLILDAALTNAETKLRNIQTDGGSTVEVAEQQKKIEAIRITTGEEERRMRALEALVGPGTTRP